jgi:hypothetical protein
METKHEKYTSWETIQKMYPDRFVLLESPVFERAQIKEAIFLYKHRNRMKVIEKELELKPHHSALVYTGGIRGDRALEKTWIL